MAKLPPGDPRRGGRGQKHGLRVGQRHRKAGAGPDIMRGFLRDPDEIAAYDQARIDSIDGEIRILKAKHVYALKKQRDDPDGGVVIGVTEYGDRIRPWFDILLEYAERIRKLVQTRHEMGGAIGDADGLEEYELWLRHNAPGGGEPPSSDS